MSSYARKYNFLVPKKLLPLIKEVEKDPPDIIGFNISRLLFLVSAILTHKQKDHPLAYSILNMEFLTKVVPKAGKYMQFLKQKDIIEWKNYSAGRNSRLYRMTRKYNGPTIWRTLEDQHLANRIFRNLKTRKYQNSKKYPHLNQYVKLTRINYEEALKTIQNVYDEMIMSVHPEIRDKAESRRTYSLGEVTKIVERHIYIKVNSTNSRYDTNFTRLPSELVKHLTLNGRKLREWDIANSQPFFAAALFDPSLDIQSIMENSLFMFTKTLQLAENEDVNLYVTLVSSGKFYEFFEQKCKENGVDFRDRKDFKEQLFKVFFDRNTAIRYSLMVRLFCLLFPSVWRMFCVIKSGQKNKLAILLQRFESYTMLDCVARKIHDEFPLIPFLTKHDSILIPEDIPNETAEQIRNLVLSTIKSVVGKEPVIRNKILK